MFHSLNNDDNPLPPKQQKTLDYDGLGSDNCKELKILTCKTVPIIVKPKITFKESHFFDFE